MPLDVLKFTVAYASASSQDSEILKSLNNCRCNISHSITQEDITIDDLFGNMTVTTVGWGGVVRVGCCCGGRNIKDQDKAMSYHFLAADSQI